MRHAAWLGVMVLALGGAVAACGKNTPPPAAPVAEDGEGEGGEDEGDEGEDGSLGGATEATPEDYDAMQRFFAKRRVQVARCYGDALEAGAIDKKAKGSMTVEMVITRDGRAEALEIVKDSLKNDAVAACVKTMIAGWELPKPQGLMSFSFVYDFEAE